MWVLRPQSFPAGASPPKAFLRSLTEGELFSFRSLTFYLLLFVIAYLVLIPLITLLYASVKSTEDKLPFESAVTTLANYRLVFGNRATYQIFYNTFLFTVGSLAIGLPLATFFTWLVERSTIPCRRWISSSILLPMAIPSLLSAMAWVQLLDPRTGLVNVALRATFGMSADSGPLDIYSLGGMCFVQGLRLVPTAFLMIVAAFRGMDPSLEEQSTIAGRGVVQTTFRVTLPVVRPALLAALIYFIIVVMESFDIPGLLGFTARIRVLSTAIYWATHTEVGLPDYGLASALGTVVLVMALVLIWLYQRLTSRQEMFAVITGKGYRPRRISLGVWTVPVLALSILYILVALVLPFFILLWTSLLPFYAVPSADSLSRITFKGYLRIWNESRTDLAIWNTVMISLAAAVVTVLLSALVSWLVIRKGSESRKLTGYLSTLSFVPKGVPSIVIGLALIFVYIRFPLRIYGTIWIIVLAMVTKYIAFGSRTMTSAQIQIHAELEEASQMSGASWFRTFRMVTAPLLAPAMVNTFLWVAVHAMQELSMALMLYNPDTVVVSTVIWNMWQTGRTSDAAVLGVILILLSAILLFGGQALASRRSRAFD